MILNVKAFSCRAALVNGNSDSRSIVGMTMYNQATQEIAKPSELLTSVRAYMTVLQSIENYVTIDITRVFNNVLLQQTQHLDSHGEPTITSLYTNWYVFLTILELQSSNVPYSVSLGLVPFLLKPF